MNFDFKQITFAQADLLSANLGDEIITSYCSEHLRGLFPNSLVNRIPTQMKLDKRCSAVINRSELAIVCGTNLIASNMRTRKQWNVDLSDIKLKTKFILCGVGWWQYQDSPDLYTKFLFKHILSKDYNHSVRDEYTKRKLNEAGIFNVINTGCPTMWNLTPEFVSKIPKHKSDKVVMTLTDYKKNEQADKNLIDILRQTYKTRYIWIQNDEDYDYFKSLTNTEDFIIIPPTLNDYDTILKNNDIDYVGTRLHGGIRALNYGRRSIIIAVDNRAKEIQNDTGLPVVERNEIQEKLLDTIMSDWKTNIIIPKENIAAWKSQFVLK